MSRFRIFVICLALTLAAGCSTAQLQENQTILAQVQATAVAITPDLQAAGCDAQAVANITTAGLTATHNTAAATESSTVSAVAGLVCNGGAPITQPVQVAGSVTVPTSTGAVTLPVIVSAVPAAQ